MGDKKHKKGLNLFLHKELGSSLNGDPKKGESATATANARFSFSLLPIKYFYLITSSPPIYFLKTSGIRIEPSAFWKFSANDTRIRGVGIAVQFSE